MTKCEAEGSGPGYDRPFFTPQNLVFFLLLDDDGWERTPRKVAAKMTLRLWCGRETPTPA